MKVKQLYIQLSTSCSLEAGKVRSSVAFLLKTPQVRLFWNNGFLHWLMVFYMEKANDGMPSEDCVGNHSKTEHISCWGDAAQQGILWRSVVQLKDWYED